MHCTVKVMSFLEVSAAAEPVLCFYSGGPAPILIVGLLCQGGLFLGLPEIFWWQDGDETEQPDGKG